MRRNNTSENEKKGHEPEVEFEDDSDQHRTDTGENRVPPEVPHDTRICIEDLVDTDIDE